MDKRCPTSWRLYLLSRQRNSAFLNKPPLYLLQIKRHFLLQLDRCHKPSEPRYAHKSVLFSRSYLVLSFEKFQKLPSTQDGVKPTRPVCNPMYIQLGTFPVCSSTSSKKLSSSKLPMLTRFPRYFLTQLSLTNHTCNLSENRRHEKL